MVYHHCVFSHGSLNDTLVRMFCHNSHKGIALHLAPWLHNKCEVKTEMNISISTTILFSFHSEQHPTVQFVVQIERHLRPIGAFPDGLKA